MFWKTNSSKYIYLYVLKNIYHFNRQKEEGYE
jgi:hypothetical protein